MKTSPAQRRAAKNWRDRQLAKDPQALHEREAARARARANQRRQRETNLSSKKPRTTHIELLLAISGAHSIVTEKELRRFIYKAGHRQEWKPDEADQWLEQNDPSRKESSKPSTPPKSPPNS
jgi:hypothetical protein